MILHRTSDRFVLDSTYAERAIPKAAGFRWDPAAKAWWTTDAHRAAKLAEYASPECRQALEMQAERDEEAINASTATDAEIDIPCPEGLAYMPFQRAGIAYALQRTAVLIGDEMGLGKTIQAIGVINADPSVRRVLVICPASLRLNWRNELKRWLTRPLSIGIVVGSEWADADVTIINYDVLKRHHDALRAQEWDLLIADEAHYLKNGKALRTQQVVGRSGKGEPISPIPARRRILLTGTPIVNRPAELHPLISYLDGKEWGGFFGFAKRYCDAHHNGFGWDFSGASHLDELQERLRRTILVRRLKRDVLTELPPKRRMVVTLPANGSAAVVDRERRTWQAHEDTIADLRARAELAKAGESDTEYEDAVRALRAGWQAAFTEMAAIRHEVAVAKIPAVIEHCDALLEETDKLVVFAHHHDVVDALAEHWGNAAAVLTGETAMDARQDAVERFQADPACRVFIGSIRAAGVGLTLTAASTVAFAELDWTPGVVSQAEDRLHRIGQQDTVLVQHLVLDGSLDAQMAQTIIGKQAVIDQALDDDLPPMPEPEAPKERPARREQIAEEAAHLTDEQVAAIHRGLQRLAAACDGARQIDGAGFSKVDASIGHSLAAAHYLTPRQAALGARLVHKYRRQLGGDVI